MSFHSHRGADSLWDTTVRCLWWAQQLSVVQSVVAAAKTAFAMALLGVTAPAAPVVVGFVTFAIYTANDLADVAEDGINCPERSAFVSDHWATVATLAVVGLLLGVGLALAAGGVAAVTVALVPVVASILYSVPVASGRRRLKDVFLVNTALVAGAWGVTVTLLPLVLAGRPAGPLAAAVCLFFVLRSVVSVEVFNVRDVVGDAVTGVDTLPVVLGVGRTRHLLATLDGCSLAVLVALTPVADASLPAVFGLAVVSYSLSITWFLGQTNATELLCLAKDGEYLLLGLVALALA
ncbi:UbiA family prenyltransferase [Halomicroarcula sp. F13]|uniref:UbiA family prenyltransferase n=1 Tax=Haloarcula rubra TaxID=2487747 RepID=A0AAW4PLU5_9EURY|nr:UbiA family prenyltransferase [Halomicroarcula rubra]MBX0322538.1 UbiA family prenyltransferase [Halomicroarcula rubra]